MKRRLNANACVMAGFCVILVAVTLDVGFRLLSGPGKPGGSLGETAEDSFAPGFRVGDLAPDFTLPDRNGTPERLSEMLSRDTLLCFTCACANCLDLQTYMGMLLKKMGPKAPDVIAVTTMPTEREETYVRDTGLQQRFLYEPKEGPVMEQYRGHPCPRVYRLNRDRRVVWIGSSPGSVPTMRSIGNELAAHLGFPDTVGEVPSGPSSSSSQGLP